MLEISKIKNNPTIIIDKLKKRGLDPTKNIHTILELDKKRIKNQQELDSLLTEGNQIAKKIANLAKEKKFDLINTLKNRASTIKSEAKIFTEKRRELDSSIKSELIQIPNIAHDETPIGDSEKDNVIISKWGHENTEKTLLTHWEIAEKCNLIDFQKGAEITGSGFPIYKGFGAQLQRGLINFFLEYNTTAGYIEYIPPYFVNEQSAFNTGQIPDKEGMMYYIQCDDLYAIPTAEVPLTNMFNNMRLKLSELPIKCTAYSPCFRREAGSYGKEVRGLNRLHQFDKVEIVQISNAEKSYQILDEMVNHVSNLLQKLNLQFRVVKLCAGDLGFTSALTYDFEVYAPGQKKWLEVSSVSNFETYQSNRLNLKYMQTNGESALCHTLNGSALALPRIIVAILEQHQKNNTITIPDILNKYLNFDKIIIPK